MKKSYRHLAGGIAAGALATVLVSSPAFAAIDFSSASWTLSDVNYGYESSGVDTYGGIEYVTTTTQSNYSLGYEETYFDGGDLTAFNDYGYCYGADASETTETNGDVVITCAPYEMANDLWLTQEYRMYDDQKLWRHIFGIENRGTSAANLDAASQGNYLYLYQYYSDNAISSSNPTADPTGSCTMSASDHWVVNSASQNTTITGWAFQATGGTAWDGTGEDCSDSPSVYVTADTLAAGAKLNYMSLIVTGEPAGASTGDMDTAFDSFVAGMSAFDSLNDTLCRGIADGTSFDGWGTCGPATPELPNTGVNGAETSIATGVAMLVLAAGVAFAVIARRRQAQA